MESDYSMGNIICFTLNYIFNTGKTYALTPFSSQPIIGHVYFVVFTTRPKSKSVYKCQKNTYFLTFWTFRLSDRRVVGSIIIFGLLALSFGFLA